MFFFLHLLYYYSGMEGRQRTGMFVCMGFMHGMTAGSGKSRAHMGLEPCLLANSSRSRHSYKLEEKGYPLQCMIATFSDVPLPLSLNSTVTVPWQHVLFQLDSRTPPWWLVGESKIAPYSMRSTTPLVWIQCTVPMGKSLVRFEAKVGAYSGSPRKCTL